ncbi:disulfide bond formation protein B [Halomonas sp. WWR20]
MMTRLVRVSTRQWCLVGLLMCLLMMGVALILQYVYALAPCPLCIFQRVAVLAAALVFIVGALHNPRRGGGVVYGALALLAVIGGMVIAGRHVWLQSLPPENVPSCGPGLDYMLEMLPLWDVLARVLSGSGECAEIAGRLLGMTIPQWTLIGFAMLALIPLGLMLSRLMQGRG